jgi:hypothetical protein
MRGMNATQKHVLGNTSLPLDLLVGICDFGMQALSAIRREAHGFRPLELDGSK